MKISYFFLLSAMLLVPQLTQAQVAGAPKAGTADAARSSVHGSIDLAKERLDEMDATLALLERKLGDFKSENRATAERAIADMREQTACAGADDSTSAAANRIEAVVFMMSSIGV